MSELTEAERRFILGLTKLTQETGIAIGGCGCCSSPFLEAAEFTSSESGYGFGYTEQLAWIDPSNDYDWERFRQSIVKDTTADQQAPVR